MLSLATLRFGITLVAFVGHIVSSVGIEVDPIKMEPVKNCPRPLSPMDFQRFLAYIGIIADLLKFCPLFLLH